MISFRKRLPKQISKDIKVVCNKEKEIAEIFNKKAKEYPIIMTSEDSHTYFTNTQFFKTINIEVKQEATWVGTSSVRHQDNVARYWHQDRNDVAGKTFNIMYLASYKYPTQFLISDTLSTDELAKEIGLPYVAYKEYEARAIEAKANKLINQGIAKIVSGNPGDVIECPPNIIHKTNYRVEGAHLVLRGIK